MHAELHHRLSAHSASLYALAPGRTPGTLFSAGADRVIAEWNLKEGLTNPFAIRMESTVYSLLNLDREWLVIGTGVGGMHVVDLKHKKEIRHLKLHDKGIFHLAKHPVKPWVYACCADGSVSIWETNQWSLLWHLPLCQGKVRRVAFDPDGGLWAVACGDGSVKVLEAESQRILYDLDAHEESANSVAFLPDGSLLSGGKDAYLKRWDKRLGFQQTVAIPAHNFAIYDIVVGPEATWIATASRDKTVKLWDPSLTHKPLRLDRKAFRGHTHSVNGLCYLEDEGLLASCSDDRSIVLWKVRGDESV